MTGEVLDEFGYDDAGRLVSWKNKDALIEWGEFNLAGEPGTTRQTRYADESGFGSETIRDSYVQHHEWNLHGERTSETMPTYDGFSPASPWTASLTYDYDAMGNLRSIARTMTDGTGGTLLTASYRDAGRPDSRTITTACGGASGCTPTTITRTYGYDGSTGLMNGMSVTSNGIEVAGSQVDYNGIQIADAKLLGVSGNARHNHYDYDKRSRLKTSVSARPDEVAPATEAMSPADFRQALTRIPTTPADPPSLSFGEAAAHKIADFTRGGETRVFTYDGAERHDDGKYLYTFDTRKRLVKVEEKPTPRSLTLRRVLYFYAGTNRLVGRRAEYNVLAAAGATPLDTDWKLEDRPDILAADGLPAETTFVWDPISDTIAAVFKAGASEAATPLDDQGGLLRQIVQGGLGYDDPIEVTVAQDAVVASSGTTAAMSLKREPADPSSQASSQRDPSHSWREKPGRPVIPSKGGCAGGARDLESHERCRTDRGNRQRRKHDLSPLPPLRRIRHLHPPGRPQLERRSRLPQRVPGRVRRRPLHPRRIGGRSNRDEGREGRRRQPRERRRHDPHDRADCRGDAHGRRPPRGARFHRRSANIDLGDPDTQRRLDCQLAPDGRRLERPRRRRPQLTARRSPLVALHRHNRDPPRLRLERGSPDPSRAGLGDRIAARLRLGGAPG